MPSEPAAVLIGASRAFKRHLRALSKKYHHIRSDIQPAIETIQSGKFLGDRIQGIEHVVFKVRVRNRDIQRGKSSGYRLIYQIETPKAALLIESIRSSTKETFHRIRFERS